MTSVFINPGSGPVFNATFDNAVQNAEVFAREIGAHSFAASTDGGDGNGRWTFTVTRDDETHEIEMPGLPLDRVRYMGEEGQNIWDFPRLYVDGSSWVWCYALGVVWNEDDEA